MRWLSSVARCANRCASDAASDGAYALRVLRRQPVFALVTTAILALTLGANTAMFGLVYQVLLAELPVREPEQLVVLKRSNLESRDQSAFDYAFFRQLDDARDVFDEVLCRAAGSERVTVGTESGGAPSAGELVCGSYFDVLGVTPHLGRLITRRDDISPGAHPVVVLSHSYWQRQFGGDPSVVGGTVRITGVPMTIIGVLPAEFTGIDPAQTADLRIPFAMQAEVRGGPAAARQPSATVGGAASQVIIVGRLRDGMTPQQAEQALTAQLRRYLADRDPTQQRRLPGSMDRVHVEPAASGIGVARRQYQSSLHVLIAATIAVLLIACLNLATVLLARAAARRNEFAVRLALGASTGRLVRQLVAEGVVLSVSGALVGAVLVYPFALLVIRLASPDASAPILQVHPTPPVVLFHAAMTALSAVVFSLAPSLAARRFHVGLVRERGAAGLSIAARRGFLIAQVAVAVVVLVGAALFVRTELALRATEVGFEADRLLVLALSPQNAGQPAEQTLPFFRTVRERVDAVPGVTGVSYGMIRPLINASWQTRVTVSGCCPEGVNALRNAVGPGYFTTLGIRVIAGREFTSADHNTAPKVAIVNETFARMYSGGGQTLGARIGVTNLDYTIIGIVKDAKYAHLREGPTPVWYVPYEQQPNVKYLDMYVRTASSPSEILASVRAAIAAVDPQIALFEVRPVQAQIDRLLLVERMLSTLSLVFASTGAVLAGLGLYGMLAWLVATRTSEIGLRLALGATPANVVRQVTADAWKALIAGVVLGTVIAALLSRYIATLLFGVSPLDPASFAAAIFVLAIIVTVAAALPVHRGARTAPANVLRSP
jgi:predicted permease